MRRLIGLGLGLGLGLGGCTRPPTEKWQAVAAERAPLLPEPEGDEPSLGGLHRGELVQVVKPVGRVEWRGKVDGVDLARSGEMVAVRRGPGESAFFAFASDIGGDVEVPAAPWLCEKMAAARECPSRLRRLQLGGALVAADPCGIGTCRVALVRDGKVAAISLDGLAAVTPAVVDGEPVVLAETRWVKGPTWTGARTFVLRVVDGRLDRALSIDTEEVDARAAPVVQRMGHLAVENGVLTFRGDRREVLPSSGAVVADQPLLETYHLARR